jgi:hypothetical protein
MRVFVGIDVPEEVRSKLAKVQRELPCGNDGSKVGAPGVGTSHAEISGGNFRAAPRRREPGHDRPYLETVCRECPRDRIFSRCSLAACFLGWNARSNLEALSRKELTPGWRTTGL